MQMNISIDENTKTYLKRIKGSGHECQLCLENTHFTVLLLITDFWISNNIRLLGLAK
jgi:hypothetical protein